MNKSCLYDADCGAGAGCFRSDPSIGLRGNCLAGIHDNIYTPPGQNSCSNDYHCPTRCCKNGQCAPTRECFKFNCKNVDASTRKDEFGKCLEAALRMHKIPTGYGEGLFEVASACVLECGGGAHGPSHHNARGLIGRNGLGPDPVPSPVPYSGPAWNPSAASSSWDASGVTSYGRGVYNRSACESTF